MAKKSSSTAWLVITVMIAVISWYFRNESVGDEVGAASNISIDQELKAADFSQVRISASEFKVLDHCRLAEHRHNDGDSFHVKCGGVDTEYRLYYVDTPESAYKTYPDGNNNGERLRQQGGYFGGLSQQMTAKVGMSAKKFTLDLLAEGEFRVVTKGERVFDSERQYAFVLVKWHGREVYLHELLVAQGLARIYTKPNTLPDHTSASRHRKKLKTMEDEARSAKRGGWGILQ